MIELTSSRGGGGGGVLNVTSIVSTCEMSSIFSVRALYSDNMRLM